MKRGVFLFALILVFTNLQAEKFDVKGFTGYEFGELYNDITQRLTVNGTSFEETVVHDVKNIDIKSFLYKEEKLVDITLGFWNDSLGYIYISGLDKKDIPLFLINKKNKVKNEIYDYKYISESGEFNVVDFGEHHWGVTIFAPTPKKPKITQTEVSSPQSESTSVQCKATTKKGTRCKRFTTSKNGYCWQHGGD